MPRLKQKLRSLLKNAVRIAIIGIGSELRGDDAVGLLVVDYLRRNFRKVGRGVSAEPSDVPIIKLFNGGTAPENLTGEIRRFKPGHLIMIDAVDMGKKPGTIALVDLKKTENTVFLTHKLPVKLMLDYMAFTITTEINGKATTAKPEGRRRVAAEMTFTTIFIGIQPKTLDFGAPVSKPVMRAGRELANLLKASSIKR